MHRLKQFIMLTSLLLTSACYADRTDINRLMFVNCTGLPIEAANDRAPYKYSLDPKAPAVNGYSAPYHFTIPAQALYTHQTLTVFSNFFQDGAMHIVFSGGINGDLLFTQDKGPITTLYPKDVVILNGKNRPYIVALGCAANLQR